MTGAGTAMHGQVSRRMGGRAFVLTGTGTLFSYGALLDVREQRRAGILLPAGSSATSPSTAG